MKTIYIQPEYPSVDRIAVQIPEDPRDIKFSIIEAFDAEQDENRRLEGVIIGAVDYYTLREHLATYRRAVAEGEVLMLEFLGMRIHMDPHRDHGPIVPIYNERDALSVLAQRVR